MAVEHVNITDPNLHEVKGASSASAGQVLVGVGDGTAEFRDSVFTTHGEMYISSYGTALALTAAGDATLNTDSEYVKITGTGMWNEGHVDGVTFSTDETVVPYAGDYELAFWTSITVASAGALVGIKYAINDSTPYSVRKVITSSKSAGDTSNISSVGFITNLSANDTVSLYIASDTTGNVTLKEAGLIIKLLDTV